MKRRLQDMTEPELGRYMTKLISFVKDQATPDTVGAMVVVFQTDMITQYASTIDPGTVPQALRELASRIERRETVRRESN